jgi:soluble lytic murein transglycosylase-like protein
MALESSAALADTDIAEAALLRLPLPPALAHLDEASFLLLRGGRRVYLRAVQRAAEVYGVPPQVADAVVQVESAYDPAAIGGVGEIGLMQVMPSTAAMLGFRGTVAELAKPGGDQEPQTQG